MPEFTICGKSEVKRTVKRFHATHLITTLDVGDSVFRPWRISAANHLRLSFDDEEDPAKSSAPTIEHAQSILDFGSRLPDHARCVVHCFAGACRSTAAGLALWLQANGHTRLEEGAAWLAAVRPEACPNLLLARHFDQIFELDGRLVELCEQIGINTINRKWKLANP